MFHFDLYPFALLDIAGSALYIVTVPDQPSSGGFSGTFLCRIYGTTPFLFPSSRSWPTTEWKWEEFIQFPESGGFPTSEHQRNYVKLIGLNFAVNQWNRASQHVTIYTLYIVEYWTKPLRGSVGKKICPPTIEIIKLFPMLRDKAVRLVSKQEQCHDFNN